MKRLISILSAVAAALPVAAQEQAQGKPAQTAQPERQRVSYKVLAGNTKYTQQHLIEVGDVPGHQVRVFEINRTFPPGTGDAPSFNGVRVTEQWARSLSDYVDANGRVFGYFVYSMENGDKVFGRYEGITQTAAAGKSTTPTIVTLTGGTGKFKDLRGLLRSTNVASFVNGRAVSNETQYEGEYWLERGSK